MSAHRRSQLTPNSAAMRRLDDLAMQMRATSRPANLIEPKETTQVYQNGSPVHGDILARLEKLEKMISEGFASVRKDIFELKEKLDAVGITVIEPGWEYDEIVTDTQDIAIGDKVIEMMRK